MTKIFISYRRSDSQERAHRIADWLVLKYGKDNIFIDVDRIPGGVDFVDVIEESLAASDVLLVVIGDKWDNELANREKSPNIDFVRFEVAYGLKNIPLVIPVLTDHNVSIDKNLLPEDVQGLLQYNFMYARLTDFHQDMQRIRTQLPDPAKKRLPLPFLAIGLIGIVIVAIFLMQVLGGNGTDATITDTPNPVTAAYMTHEAANRPTATATDDAQATIDAIVTELAQTDIAATQVILNQDSTETAIALANRQATQTSAAQALTDEAATQNAQSTANAPTNTPLPTDTPTNTLTPTPPDNFTETAIVQTAISQTQLAVHTQAVQTAVAIDNARSTATAEASQFAPHTQAVETITAIALEYDAETSTAEAATETSRLAVHTQAVQTVTALANGDSIFTETAEARLVAHTQAVETVTAVNIARMTATAETVGQSAISARIRATTGIIRAEPNNRTEIIETLEVGEEISVFAYISTDADSANPYWVQTEDGYIWLGALTTSSQTSIQDAAEDGTIPTIVWNE